MSDKGYIVMAAEKKIYVSIQAASITKIYDKSLKTKLLAEMASAAKKTIDKNKKLTSSKPTGWKKENDKGFVLNMQLKSLTKTKAKNEIIIKASVAAVVADTKSGQGIKKQLSGNGMLKIAANHKNPDGEALFIAGHAIATLIKEKAIKVILG